MTGVIDFELTIFISCGGGGVRICNVKIDPWSKMKVNTVTLI